MPRPRCPPGTLAHALALVWAALDSIVVRSRAVIPCWEDGSTITSPSPPADRRPIVPLRRASRTLPGSGAGEVLSGQMPRYTLSCKLLPTMRELSMPYPGVRSWRQGVLVWMGLSSWASALILDHTSQVRYDMVGLGSTSERG